MFIPVRFRFYHLNGGPHKVRFTWTFPVLKACTTWIPGRLRTGCEPSNRYFSPG